jgi:uncharacterized membrane protein YkvI
MIQVIVAMTIAILRGHDGDEHNTHQNDITIITKAMIFLILMVFTYSHSDSKNKTYYVGKQDQQSQWKLN